MTTLTVDITDDTGAFEDPSRLVSDVDGCVDITVVQFGPVELRMTFLQFCHFVEACNEWLFRNCRDEFDLNDEDFIPEQEHQLLRKLVTKLTTGEPLGTASIFPGVVEVPDTVRRAIFSELKRDRVPWGSWADREDRIRALELEVAELKGRKPRRSPR